MSRLIPIKFRLNSILQARELYDIKQALIIYLAATDPELTKTTFSLGLLTNILPYLKSISPAWESMEPQDINLSKLAIKSMYHMLRNHFMSSKTICKDVKEYLLKEIDVVEQNKEEVETTKVADNVEMPHSQSSDREIRALNRHQTSNLGKRSVRQPDNLMSLFTNEPSKIIAKEGMGVDQSPDLTQISPFLEEFISMTFEIRVRKREVKAIEKEMIAIQKKFLGSDDSNKENE